MKLSLVLIWVSCSGTLLALEYPGTAPGRTQASLTKTGVVLENAAIRGEWEVDAGRIAALTLVDKGGAQSLTLNSGHLPQVVLGNGQVIDLASLVVTKPIRMESHTLSAEFRDVSSGLTIQWHAGLSEGANAIIQTLKLTASRDAEVKELVFIDAPMGQARQVGQVDGSVVVTGNLFIAVEHPLAKNHADENGQVRCALPRGNTLKAGQSWTYASAIGVTPAGQLRRGFLYYLERRRAHAYRPFLHYNNWYDVLLGRKEQRITEAECLAAIVVYQRELVRKRGVRLDAYVWDDGWDNLDSLWEFHDGFPRGFQKLNTVAQAHGASMGVWMSPWGGYASAKERRMAFGRTRGFETNANGFSMAGPNYQKAYREVCLRMMREHGVNFFKFDGMGGGNRSTGAEGGLADDIDAVLELTRALRRENSEVFISATVGTWASPFWLFYADSIWRQGDDINLMGKGNTRQQWITYRDHFCYQRIVKLGPLYPLNSVMLLGPAIGDRSTRATSMMVLDEKSVVDEIWSFFGSGANVQELYVSPEMATEAMWDAIAKAAKWSRSNSDALVDTHWVGGDPGKTEVYGWASWRRGKGILVLRNPSESSQEFSITAKAVLELPAAVAKPLTMKAIHPDERPLPTGPMDVDQPITLTLKPFEVIVIELVELK